MVGLDSVGECGEGRLDTRALRQPFGVAAVARAIHVAAGDAIVDCTRSKRRRASSLHTARSNPHAPQAAPMERATMSAAVVIRPVARDDGERGPFTAERGERVLHEALRAAEAS